MIRMFTTHTIRPVEELDGIWEFEPITRGQDFPSHYRYKMSVPGVWEMHPGFARYRGLGAFRRLIEVRMQQNLRVAFAGVSHTADVYWDGKLAAHHYNAYTGFEFVIEQVPPGSHELVIVVDNAFHDQSTLHIANDYYTYGGIIRPVSMETVGPVFVAAIRFTPIWDGSAWSAEIGVGVRSLATEGQRIRVVAQLGSHHIALVDSEIGGRATTWFTSIHRFTDVSSWSPDQPTLYLLRLELFSGEDQEPCDDLIDRVGFRSVSVDADAVAINGEPIMIRGFNRHEDYPGVGSALTVPLMVQDMELLRDLGANAIRTSHYPNDQRFLDLCDEYGMLVWEEHHARDFNLTHMQQPLFETQITESTREMVTKHANHPAIVIWGIFNECASDSLPGRAMYEQQLNLIRSLDGSRPLSYATHHRDRDRCLDLVDIVSFNLYPLWYTEEDPAELFCAARGWADSLGGLGKPLIISEMGADGFYGFRDGSAGLGSEERQRDILIRDIVAALSERVAGMFIWQFADCRVSEGRDWLFRRAMGQNSKGVVDRYRRPKLAYQAVQELYRQAAKNPNQGSPSGER